MPRQRETVVRAALHLLDEVGLDGLTGASPCHVSGHSEPDVVLGLYQQARTAQTDGEPMIADAFAELQPLGPDQDWADWLAEFARLLRRMSLTHRDGARTLAEAGLFPLSNFFVGIELALDVLQNAGLEGRKAAAGVIAVFTTSWATPLKHRLILLFSRLWSAIKVRAPRGLPLMESVFPGLLPFTPLMLSRPSRLTHGLRRDFP